jgi:hypothetical protein
MINVAHKRGADLTEQLAWSHEGDCEDRSDRHCGEYSLFRTMIVLLETGSRPPYSIPAQKN